MNHGRASEGDPMRATHSEWLAAEIQEAIDDPCPSVAHDEVMAIMEAEIAAVGAKPAMAARCSDR